ncbi:unnamed protein product [Scytosiphon promiscuus]
MTGAGGERTGWGGEGSRIRGGGGGGGGKGGNNGRDGTVPPGPSLQDQLFGAITRRGQSNARGDLSGPEGIATPGGSAAASRGGSGVIAEQKAVMASQDAYLDSVGEAVRELGLLGRNIGASLDGQGAALDRVVDKTADTEDRTAFVTRKAARQAQGSKPKKPTFVMSVALQEVSTGLFLAVTGEEIVLEGTELRNVCRFEAWERQHGIIGLKSGVTGRWLGQTFLGYLRASGTSFGKNHEWQTDLRRQQTTMVCCSANWGAGGYLCVRANNNNSNQAGGGGATCDNPESATAAAGGAEAFTTAGDGAERAELSLVDATLVNKPRAAVFRAINLDGYTPQPFVGGRLMPNPADGAVRRGPGTGGPPALKNSYGGGR